MNELENRHRKYLGLAETDHSWIRVEVKEHVIYHNGVHVLKHIEPVPDRFSKTEISKFKSCGVYFSYCKPHVKIGNINLQRTFIEDETADLYDLKKFSSAARCRQKYREGDFFAFKLSRRSWGLQNHRQRTGRRIRNHTNRIIWAQDLCHVHEDLRNPANLKDRRLIFRHFGLHAAPKAL